MTTYSPHHDGGGGTLHLPSPTHLSPVDSTSALARIRRSLSRSPSKSPAFRLLGSPCHSPVSRSPLSPTAEIPNDENLAPLEIQTILVPPMSTRKNRPTLRRPSPMRSSTRSIASCKSPAKRPLGECSDHGNANPSSELSNEHSSSNDKDNESSPITAALPPVGMNSRFGDAFLAPSHARPRRERLSGFFDLSGAKSSPLKRSDGSTSLDLAQLGSPSAKRRSLHGAPFEPDFDIFDMGAVGSQSPSRERSNSDASPSEPAPAYDPRLVFASLPRRASSLRRTTLQQRHDKPVAAKAKPNSSLALELGSNTTRSRPRLALESIFPVPSRESPFAGLNSLPSASLHPLPIRREALTNGDNTHHHHHARHPLSRTLTTSSSNSSVVEDSPTHIPFRHPEPRRPRPEFTQSLPAGALPPHHVDGSNGLSSQNSTFATPDNYKLAKPLPAAFMSTGLISKRNKNLRDEPLDLQGSPGHMPDTPCKRPNSNSGVQPAVAATPEVHLARGRPSRHSFGTPSTPYNPHIARPPSTQGFGHGVSIFGSQFPSSVTQRASFIDHDAVDGFKRSGPLASGAHSSIPPTPTKHVHSSSTSDIPNGRASLGKVEGREAVPRQTSDSPGAKLQTSPLLERFGRKAPQTPSDSMLPPDPSGLSISGRAAVPVPTGPMQAATSFFAPATPTMSRDGFGRTLPLATASVTPVHQHHPLAEVDASLNSRFDRTELIGDGEFSQVFRVTRFAEPHVAASQSSPTYFGLARRSDVAASVHRPDQVWAVKKTRHAFLGPKDRQRKMQEVQILKALRHSAHTIEYLDDWEHDQHLYIQTEYCEEGTLDTFLDKVGRRWRLDDFRIWKILLELSMGLKHIHDANFMHLDLKPANVLITFDGSLKIADFGLATPWPAPPGVEGEGDREYIGPEILLGQYDKPADVFALGLILLEIAGNVMLPDNGASWQRLRSGDWSDVPSLTSSSDFSSVSRDTTGQPVPARRTSLEVLDGLYAPPEALDALDAMDTQDGSEDETTTTLTIKTPPTRSEASPHTASSPANTPPSPSGRAGELQTPPVFMVDPDHPHALDRLVRWMIAPRPADRPLVADLLATAGVRFALARRRAGATVYEGNWGPADEVLQDDAEMIDV